MYNATGRLLRSAPYDKGEHPLYIREPSGVYVLVLKHAGGNQSVRIVLTGL